MTPPAIGLEAPHRKAEHPSGVAVAFEPRFHEAAMRDGLMADELRGALGRNEFVVHYQPVIDLRTGETRGAEVLLRWARTGHDLQPPEAFLEAAGRLGLMPGISTYVLSEACGWARSQIERRGSAPFMIEVNIAPSDLGSPSFVDLVTETLAMTDLDPARLCLEVGESGFLGHLATASLP